MADQLLINYVRKCLRAGYKVKQVKTELKQAGWPQALVQDAVDEVVKEIASVTGVLEATLIMKIDDKSLQIYSNFLKSKSVDIDKFRPGSPPLPEKSANSPHKDSEFAASLTEDSAINHDLESRSFGRFTSSQKVASRKQKSASKIKSEDLAATVLMPDTELPASPVEPQNARSQSTPFSQTQTPTYTPTVIDQGPEWLEKGVQVDAKKTDRTQMGMARWEKQNSKKISKSSIVFPVAAVIALALLMDDKFLPNQKKSIKKTESPTEEVVAVLSDEKKFTEILPPIQNENYEEYKEEILTLKLSRDPAYFAEQVIRPCHASTFGDDKHGRLTYISPRVPITVSGEASCMQVINQLASIWEDPQFKSRQFQAVSAPLFGRMPAQEVIAAKSRITESMKQNYAAEKKSLPQILPLSHCPCMVVGGSEQEVAEAVRFLKAILQ